MNAYSIQRGQIIVVALLLFATTSPRADDIASTPPETAPALTLNNAVGAALDQNPALRALRHRIQSLEAEVIQAKVLPNPELGGEVENVAGNGEFSGTDAAEYTVMVSQPFLLGGKRAKRVHVAKLDRRMAEWTYESTKRDLVSRVTATFIGVLEAQEQVALSGKLVSLSEELVEAAKRRVKSGGASVLEQTKAEIERAARVTEQEQMMERLRASSRRLGTLIGMSFDDVVSVSGNLYQLHELPTFEDLKHRLADNPNLARRHDEIEQREAEAALENAQRIPDVNLGVGWKRDESAASDGFVFAASIPLPLFDRNQGARQAARHEQAAAVEQRREIELELERELIDVYADMGQAHAQAMAIEKIMLPAATKAFDVSHEGYLQGRFGYLDMLDAQRTLFEAKGTYIESLTTYHQAVAEIERLTGKDTTIHNLSKEE